MGEFASKGVAGSGLGLGIAGTALGVLNASCCGGGLLGGLFGNGNRCGYGTNGIAEGVALSAMAEKDAKIAELTAMRYSDNQDVAVYKQTLADNKTLRDEMYAYITPIAQESASNRERVAVLEAQQKCEIEKALLREQIVVQRIDNVAQQCGCGISQLNAAVAGLTGRVNAITKEVVPLGAICPQAMPRFNDWQSPEGSTQVTVSDPARARQSA